jgi:large subunit ribosomal protein L29
MLMNDVRNMSTAELETKLDDTREELFKLRFQFKTGQLTDYSRLHMTRRTIAQMSTVLRERELAEQMRAAAGGEQK